MRGYGLRAIDKDLGSVEDFQFDDRLWKVRYLVADMGNWLPGRKVIIGQEALKEPNWDDRIFPVTLTSTEVESSPGITSHLPFSLDKERELRLFFQWRKYWDDAIFHPTFNQHAKCCPGARACRGLSRTTGEYAVRSAGKSPFTIRK